MPVFWLAFELVFLAKDFTFIRVSPSSCIIYSLPSCPAYNGPGSGRHVSDVPSRPLLEPYLISFSAPQCEQFGSIACLTL